MRRYRELEEEIIELRARVARLELKQELYLSPSSLQNLGKHMRKHIDARVEEVLRDKLEIYIKVKEVEKKRHGQ